MVKVKITVGLRIGARDGVENVVTTITARAKTIAVRVRAVTIRVRSRKTPNSSASTAGPTLLGISDSGGHLTMSDIGHLTMSDGRPTPISNRFRYE